MFKHVNNEEGSVIVYAVMILVLLTMIGVSGTNRTSVELTVASNELVHKMAFYVADTGVYVIPQLVSAYFDNDLDGTPLPSGFTFEEDDDSTFQSVALGFNTSNTPAVNFNFDNYTVDTSLEFKSRENTPGSELGTSINFYYDIDSTGNGPKSSISKIEADYRHVYNLQS